MADERGDCKRQTGNGVTGKRIDAIREFIASQGQARPKPIAQALGYNIDQVRASLDTLVRTGAVIRIRYGWYQFVPSRESNREAPIEDRIWRAMQINPTFAASDLAIQAGSTTSYIYKRMREYVAEGYVGRAGRRPMMAGGSEKLWRLTAKGRSHLERPKVEAFEPSPLVMMTVRLNRLVCSGMASRYGDARKEAVRICVELMMALGDGGENAAG